MLRDCIVTELGPKPIMPSSGYTRFFFYQYTESKVFFQGAFIDFAVIVSTGIGIYFKLCQFCWVSVTDQNKKENIICATFCMPFDKLFWEGFYKNYNCLWWGIYEVQWVRYVKIHTLSVKGLKDTVESTWQEYIQQIHHHLLQHTLLANWHLNPNPMGVQLQKQNGNNNNIMEN